MIAKGIVVDDNVFGLLAVTLQSFFDGGELRLHYGDGGEVFENSGKEEFEISASSWYMDAAANIGPITRGRRVILLYSLH